MGKGDEIKIRGKIEKKDNFSRFSVASVLLFFICRNRVETNYMQIKWITHF
jgi:hypothetical protein